MVELVKRVCNCKGDCKRNVIAEIMDLPAHLFANAMQLVAETIRNITGLIKTRTRGRGRTLTDSSSSAKSLVNQYNYASVDYTIGIFVDLCDSKYFLLYRN